MRKATIRIRVNGREHERTVDVRLLLSDFLRDELGLKGTTVGCEHGICGCCTVLLNGSAVRSCLLFAVMADGADVRTVESLATGGALHPLQQAFHEHHALQCGFCTPGMLMSTCAFLAEADQPTRHEVREHIAGHLCRCTGYQHIIEAVQAAAADLASGKTSRDAYRLGGAVIKDDGVARKT